MGDQSRGMPSRLAAVPLMVGDVLRGRYDGLSRRRLTLMGLAAAYIVSPVDLMPEALLTIPGLADDAAVGAWLAASLFGATSAYRLWASPQPQPPTQPAIPPRPEPPAAAASRSRSNPVPMAAPAAADAPDVPPPVEITPDTAPPSTAALTPHAPVPPPPSEERASVPHVGTSRCPKCGGMQRTAIAPGYYQCQSQTMRLVPDLRDGRPVPLYGLCSHQYREGPVDPSAPMCECGTYAIGVCQVCGEDVCGLCSQMVGGKRWCTACATRWEANRATEERAAYDSLPRLLGESLARWLADAGASGPVDQRYVQQAYEARLTDVSGNELADALALTRFEYRPPTIKPRPWEAAAWRVIKNPPHPGGWHVERTEGVTKWDYYEGWWLQRDGSAMHVRSRYIKRSGGMTELFVHERRPGEHTYDTSRLQDLRRHLTQPRYNYD